MDYLPAIFGLVGTMIGCLIAGTISLNVARNARQAAEHAWIRDNRRETYDRFLTCAQELLMACEAQHRRSPGSSASNESDEEATRKAYQQFFESYGVIQVIAKRSLVGAARDYAYRLMELSNILDSTGAFSADKFGAVAQTIRQARQETIDVMRGELGLTGSAKPLKSYNPFQGIDLAEDWAGIAPRQAITVR